MTGFPWTRYAEDLRRLVEDYHLSAGSAASQLSLISGWPVTRNMVISRCRAQKLRLHSSLSEGDRELRRRQRRILSAARKAGVAAPAAHRDPPKPRAPPPPIILGGHGCSWPIGDPQEPDYHSCGEPAVERKSYCPRHCAQSVAPKPINVRKLAAFVRQVDSRGQGKQLWTTAL